MKKIVLSLMTMGAVFFGSQNLQAQEETEVEGEVAFAAAQDEYAEVEIMALPQAVTDAIAKDYSEATTEKAWVKTDGEIKIYKIDLNDEGEIEQVFIDENGKWIEDENDDQK